MTSCRRRRSGLSNVRQRRFQWSRAVGLRALGVHGGNVMGKAPTSGHGGRRQHGDDASTVTRVDSRAVEGRTSGCAGQGPMFRMRCDRLRVRRAAAALSGMKVVRTTVRKCSVRGQLYDVASWRRTSLVAAFQDVAIAPKIAKFIRMISDDCRLHFTQFCRICGSGLFCQKRNKKNNCARRD